MSDVGTALSWRDVIAAIRAVGDEGARRGEMFPQTREEQNDDRRAVDRVCEMITWYATRGGAVAESLPDWPRAVRSENPLLSQIKGKSCRTGHYEICHAAKKDGVVCADGECDIDNGVRSLSAENRGASERDAAFYALLKRAWAKPMSQETYSEIKALVAEMAGRDFAALPSQAEKSGEDADNVLKRFNAAASLNALYAEEMRNLRELLNKEVLQASRYRWLQKQRAKVWHQIADMPLNHTDEFIDAAIAKSAEGAQE